MVVLTGGNGATYQPSNNVTTSSPVKTMDSSGIKKKNSPLLDKSAVQIKLVPLAIKRSNNNLPRSEENATATDVDTNLPVVLTKPLDNELTKRLPSDATQMTSSPAAVVPQKRRKGRPPKSSVTLKASAKAKNAAEKSTTTLKSKVLLDNVIPFITCNLCKGYLIDATTIVECLHTFCHSCIMIHLRQKQYCPCCELMINKTKPNIKPDAIRQAIVYKLVPGLYEKEILKRQEFYRAHPEDAKLATPEQRGEDTENLIFSPNENISLSIEYADIEEADDLDGVWKTPKYLQCPASFTVNMLSKFIVMKIGMDANKFLVDISYKVKTIVLSDYYTLMDVAYIYTWKREAPMRFFFSVRTKETTNQELPEVPLRRSPGISASTSLTPLLVELPALDAASVNEVNTIKENATSDKPESASASMQSPPATGETKLKLVKKVDECHRVSDKKRVVYMVQSADNGPQISAAAAYNLLPHESTAVGVNATLAGSQVLLNGSVGGGGGSGSSRAAKQQQLQPVQLPRTAEEATPRYRSLVEKENAKMKKLMQSLSEEKKLLKLRKREAMKDSTVSPNTSLKMKITKSDTGLMVIQNSVDEEPRDVFNAIGSVANCDVNDEKKKSLFLRAFQLAPKQASIAENEQKMLTPTSVKPTELKKSISFGFSSYEFEKSEQEDKDTEIPPLRSSTPKAESVKQSKSPSNPSPGEKTKTKSSTPLKRSASDEKLSPGQPIQRKKFSSYVKIAPKEMAPPKLQPKLAPKTAMPEKVQPPRPTLPTPNKLNRVNIPTMVMAPPPVPQPPPQQRTPANGSIYAFLQPNPSPKTLFKPMPGPGGLQNISGFSHSQFQTMPSPVYMTNANAGSTPIYSPNSPQYAPNFSLTQNQQFKYAKFPTYMTNFSVPSISTTMAPPTQPALNTPKVMGPVVAAKPKKDQKVIPTASAHNKGVSYLSKLPPPPVFSPSSGMSITTTTTMVGPSPPPLAVLPKRSPEATESSNPGKRKNTSSPGIPVKPQSPAASREDPPEKQRKVQSLLDSCNITFPSSLSITIANENEDSDKSGLHNNKLKNPVNNYIEILKIPSGDPANCSPSSASAAPADQNNKFPLSASTVMQQQHSQQSVPNNPGTFTSSSNVMKPPTPPITTSTAMKLGSSGSMSITPAITSNIMHLIKGNIGPKSTSSSVDLKRKSPPTEKKSATTVKRPSPSPPQPHVNAGGPSKPPVTSTAAEAKKPKSVPKLMPKLNPIEKVNKTPQPSPAAVGAAKPTAPATTNSLGAAAIAAAAITSAKETFQREFLKFAKDKPDGKTTVVPAAQPVSPSATKAPLNKAPVEANKALPPTADASSQKVQRKSPVKIKPKQQQKIQPAPPNNSKPQLPELRMNTPPAIAPFPLASQQQQQQRQQQEYAAALFKMMINSQHQQKIAALQQSQFPPVLGDLMMPNSMAMFSNPPSPQQQQQLQLNSLLQQAFYQEHLERMKQAGKEALEQYAQNIQHEANSKLSTPPSSKLTGSATNNNAPGKVKKGPSPVPTSKTQLVKEEVKKSPPKSVEGSAKSPSEDLKKSPKPLQMNNNNQTPIKQEDKKDIKA